MELVVRLRLEAVARVTVSHHHPRLGQCWEETQPASLHAGLPWVGAVLGSQLGSSLEWGC